MDDLARDASHAAQAPACVLDPGRLALLRAELPDAAVVVHVLGLYRDTLAERIADIARAADPEQRRRAAHALRSSSLQIGAEEVAEAAWHAGRQIEPAALAALRSAAARLDRRLDQELTGTGASASTSERASR
ncbi:MAG: Hpt domain-containing protein [Nitriliruptoraceae bacterium]